MGAVLLASGLLLLSGSVESGAAEEIYVGGIPDAWPVEYYDKESGTYQGVIPDLLRTAGEAAGFTVSYIQPSGEDTRLELAGNVQVDMVCALGLEEDALAQAGLEVGESFLVYTEDGEDIYVAMAYTKSITAGERERLEKALADLEESQIQGAYLFHARKERQGRHFLAQYGTVFLIVFGLVLVLLFVVSLGFSRKKKKIESMAYLDDVTGKGNLADWKRRMGRLIVDENREYYAVTFLSGGIDVISHIYGYEEAQNALKLFSDVCADWLVQEKEAFARFNDYYFVFFLQFTNEQLLKNRISGLYEKLEQRFAEEKKKYFLELNMGIYRLTAVDKDPLKAVQYSEVAAEFAKAHYIGAVAYDEMVEKETISGYAMEHEAIHGLVHQEFIIYLQPILDLETGSFYGAEALVRWQNPNRGLMSPAEFLYIMKKKQLLGKMDIEIYRQGCRFLQKEQERGNQLHLMFNFTSENIGNDQFPDILRETARQFGVTPERIIIQLNLGEEGKDVKAYTDTIRRLREYGFDVWLSGLVLDEVFFEFLDCGVNGIKLGHELVGQLSRPSGEKVIESVAALCHELQLKMLCVGAENEAQVERLKQLGCELASGLYFYYPVTPESFEELLASSAGPEADRVEKRALP